MIKNSLLPLSLDLLLAIGLIGGFWLLVQATSMRVEQATFTLEGGEPQAFDHPLVRGSDSKNFTVNMDLIVPLVHSNIVHIIPDDCLVQLWINDVEVPLEEEVCWQRGGAVYIGEHMHGGRNALRALVRDEGGFARFKIRPSIENDPMYLIPTILMMAGLFTYGFHRLR